MSKNTDKIKATIKKLEGLKSEYISSSEFDEVAEKALINFVKRVRRGLMPDLSAIPALESKAYLKLRKDFSFQLGELGKVNKSNATATGQMLEAMAFEIVKNGFKLLVKSTSRQGELGDRKSKIDNRKLAEHYSETRDIFDWSAPEIERIKRDIKKDLLKLIREVKRS